MARQIRKLNAISIGRISKPGLHADGGGLYLRVTVEGTRNWVFRYMLGGRARWMGLGPLHTFSLADARRAADECRKSLYDGNDPIEARRAARREGMLEAAKAITFKECAGSFIEAHKAGWSNRKHAKQWTATLATYAAPVIGKLPVRDVDTHLVMRILTPIWTTKPETATRVRSRIEAILDWARVQRFRDGENPARWRGHLDKLLAKRAKVRSVKHHAAIKLSDLPAFLHEVRGQGGVAAQALEFLILTAARTGEVIGATWAEIDLGTRTWTVPAERMKMRREHRVPLSVRAVAILSDLRAAGQDSDKPSPLVFCRHGKPLSNMALLMLLRRMGRTDITAHGFRSTFRDWASEVQGASSEVAEMALAHTVGDKTQAAYLRADLLEPRRRLMAAWAAFCEQQPTAASNPVAYIATGGR